MGVVEAIEDWRDFYSAVANAAAALLGLVFVGMSLHLSLRRAPPSIRSLALGSAITLLFPMLVALLMLVPFGAPPLHAFGLVLLAVILAVELAFVMHRRIGEESDSLPWLVYRFGIPLSACALLAAGGVALLWGWTAAVMAPAVFVFAMFVVGIQDAVDLLMGERGTLPWRRRPMSQRKAVCASRGGRAFDLKSIVEQLDPDVVTPDGGGAVDDGVQRAV